MMVTVHVFDHFRARFGILGNVPSSEEAREAARNANGQTAFSRLGLASTPPMDDAGLRIHTAAQGVHHPSQTIEKPEVKDPEYLDKPMAKSKTCG